MTGPAVSVCDVHLRRGARDSERAGDAATARLVIDDERLAQPLLELLAFLREHRMVRA